MPTESFLDATEEELLRIANGCLTQAGSAVSGPSTVKADLTKLRLFLEEQLCLTEVIRKCADKAAQRDRDHENRHVWIEIIVVAVLIAAELGVSIYYGRLGVREGKDQAVILDQMNKNTAATAVQIQNATEAMTATLQVLRAERADRLAQQAKKPRLALFIGNTPLDRASIQLQAPTGLAQDTASFDLSLKNQGDAPVNTSRLHALTPKDTFLETDQLITVPESEPPADPNTVRTTPPATLTSRRRDGPDTRPHLRQEESTRLQDPLHSRRVRAASCNASRLAHGPSAETLNRTPAGAPR